MLDDDPDGPSFVAEVTKQYMEDAAEHTTKLRTLATEDDPQWKKIDATAHQCTGSSSKCVVAAAAPGARRSPQRRRSARPALLPSEWQVLSRPTEWLTRARPVASSSTRARPLLRRRACLLRAAWAPTR